MTKRRAWRVALVLSCPFVAVVHCGDTQPPAPATEAGVLDSAGAPEVVVEGDASRDEDAAPSCSPVARSWSAPPIPRAIPFVDACEPYMVTTVIDCLFRLPSTECAAAIAEGGRLAKCAACIVTPKSAPIPGPIVVADGLATFNQPGCLASFLDKDDIGDCPFVMADLDACQSAACTQCTASLSGFGECRTLAAQTMCKGQQSFVDGCLGGVNGLLTSPSPAAICARDASFDELAILLGEIFCAAPRDASIDAPTD